MNFLKVMSFGAQFLLAATVFAQDISSAKVLPGSYQIRNKEYGELLRPENANGAVGTRIVLYPAQPWKCMTWKIQPGGEGCCQLQNYFTSKTFAPEGAGDKPEPRVTQVLFAKQPGENPAWQFSKLPDGSYKIVEAKSGRALTAAREDGSVKVVVRVWVDKDDQKWELLPIDPKQLTM